MPTIMKRRDPLAKDAVDIQARAQKRLKALEDAGNISGRTQAEADAEADIDSIFGPVEVTDPNNDMDWIDKLLNVFGK